MPDVGETSTRQSHNDAEMPTVLPFPPCSMSRSDFVDSVESLLHRPMVLPQERHLRFLNSATTTGTFKKASEKLLSSQIKTVGIIVGCPANVSCMPPTDLDGLVGAAALAYTLMKLDKKSVLLSAAINQQALHQLLLYYPKFRDISFDPFDWDDVGVVGPPLDPSKSIELRTFVPPTGWNETWDKHSRDIYSQLDAIIVVNYPGISRKGTFTNWRGMTMHHYIARFERYIRWAKRDGKPTITFCVSGNELGSKAVATEVEESSSNGVAYATDSESDIVIVGHTSNLISYGLVACMAAKNDKALNVIEDVLIDETPEEVSTSKLLEIGVDDAQSFFESLANVGEVCLDPYNAYGRKKCIRGLHVGDIFDVKYKIAKFAAMANVIDRNKVMEV